MQLLDDLKNACFVYRFFFICVILAEQFDQEGVPLLLEPVDRGLYS